MKVYLNQAIAGLGEADDLVEVEDEERAANLVAAGFADEVEYEDAPPVRPQAPGLGPVPDVGDKSALIAYAAALGVEVRRSWTGKRIRQAITDRLDAITAAPVGDFASDAREAAAAE